MREATLTEIYRALRQNGVDIISSSFFSIIMFMRKTKIEEI